MPHQCTRCGKVYADASEEILKGCSCGSKFFYYIRQEKIEELKKEAQEAIEELDKADKIQIEKDIRELTGLDEKPEEPVILDLESVKVLKPGKFEIDIVNLFSKKRPLIYKLEEGKYIIDLASSLKVDKDEVNKKIRDPTKFLEKIKGTKEIEKDKKTKSGEELQDDKEYLDDEKIKGEEEIDDEEIEDEEIEKENDKKDSDELKKEKTAKIR